MEGHQGQSCLIGMNRSRRDTYVKSNLNGNTVHKYIYKISDGIANIITHPFISCAYNNVPNCGMELVGTRFLEYRSLYIFFVTLCTIDIYSRFVFFSVSKKQEFFDLCIYFTFNIIPIVTKYVSIYEYLSELYVIIIWLRVFCKKIVVDKINSAILACQSKACNKRHVSVCTYLLV